MIGVGNELGVLAARAQGAIPRLPGDYEKDGILYCGKCNTPKQTWASFDDHYFKAPCMCKCMEEGNAKKDAERKERERQAEIRNMRTNGVQDKALIRYTFETAQDTPLIQTAKRYVEHFDELRKKGAGLLLWGGVGNGKTFAAACIANALIDQGKMVLLTNFPKLLSELSGMYPEDRHGYIGDLMKYSLLVIDDFGTERKTDFGYEQVYSIIDAWYTSGIPMVMTTNLMLDEMKKPSSVGYDRIYDRVLERCVPVKSSGKSFRKEKAKDNLQWARELLRSDGDV